MINRELIRLKVVQLLFGNHFNESSEVGDLAKKLNTSLLKSYDLYHYLLMFMVDLHHVAEKQVEAAEMRWNRLHEGDQPSRRFVDNPFILQLEANEQLKAHCHNGILSWEQQEQYLWKLFENVKQSESYQAYMQLQAPTYNDHKKVWSDIYLNFVCNNEFIDSLLEDENLYWNDDKHLVDSFVLKTIELFREQKGAEQPLLRDFRNDEDREFAFSLLRCAVEGGDTYRDIIGSHLQAGWDLERIATMDLVIMQVALAEILNFPTIPLNVTINEYIEIAKDYSTPQSGAYVNGMLDAMARTLRKQGLTNKEKQKR